MLLSNDPGLVNRDPYHGGWMIKIKLTNLAEADKLLSVEEYLKRQGIDLRKELASPLRSNQRRRN